MNGGLRSRGVDPAAEGESRRRDSGQLEALATEQGTWSEEPNAA